MILGSVHNSKFARQKGIGTIGTVRRRAIEETQARLAWIRPRGVWQGRRRESVLQNGRTEGRGPRPQRFEALLLSTARTGARLLWQRASAVLSMQI